MNYQIKGFLPIEPFHYFEEISAIPRPSLHEGKIADYLEQFAKTHGLSCYRDTHHNVLICKNGCRGREEEPSVLLQAHTDMVAEVQAGFSHDFLSEGLTLLQRGTVLSADRTTLGADDGFGVAVMLAILADKTASHPPLECLFTSAEEIGLVGASAFDYDRITARRMVNLDSAEEDLIITGCCGGIRTTIEMPISKEPLAGTAIALSLGGLFGGHSGEDIHRGRLNAHATMGALLLALREMTDFRLVSVSGGEKDNAIPRECEAVLVPQSLAAAKAALPRLRERLASLITAREDEGAYLRLEELAASSALTAEDTEHVLMLLCAPNGILRARADGSPEKSRNLARIRTEDSVMSFGYSSRSPMQAQLNESCAELEAFAAATGGKATHVAPYPGWESPADSPLTRAWSDAMLAVTGKRPATTVIHAGLECGLITGACKGMEAISVGCNVHDLHTPKETMELDSMERVYRTMIKFLQLM